MATRRRHRTSSPGCAFTVPPSKPQPCLKVQWLVPAARVLVGGQPAILQSSSGLCLSAEQIPQGPPSVRRHPDAGDGDLTDVDFPYHVDVRGRTAPPTTPSTSATWSSRCSSRRRASASTGRPSAAGLMRLVFDPNREELATATQLLVQGSLQQWLGDLVQVEDAQVDDRRLAPRGVPSRTALRPHPGAAKRRACRGRFGERPQLYCPTDARREPRRSARASTAIDYLEVLPSQRTLLVHCFRERSRGSTRTTC